MRDDRASGFGPARPGDLAAIIATRLGVNLLLRFPYVFLTAISRGFGLGVDATTALLGVRELGGLTAPALGRVADRGHERATMTATLAVAGVATLGVAVAPNVWFAGVALVAGGPMVFGLHTAQTAWLGHRVPYHRRGRVFGLVELSWAGAFFVGVPICSWLLDRHGWRAPFVFTGFLLLVLALGTRLMLPADAPPLQQSGRPRHRPDLSGPLVGLYAFVFLQPFAQMFVFAVAGDWMADRLGLGPAALGAAAVAIGLGELSGTALTTVATDRMGKRRAAMTGLACAVPAAAALGLVGQRPVLGVALLVATAVGIEFGFVSAIPLLTELDPESRGAALGLATAVMTAARAISSALAGLVYTRGGIGAVGLVAALAVALAAVALARFVVEPVAGNP